MLPTVPTDPNINTVLIAALGLVGTAFAAWLSFLSTRIHKAVNSTLAMTQQENQRLTELVTALSNYATMLEGPEKSLTVTAKSLMDSSIAGKPVNPNIVKS